VEIVSVAVPPPALVTFTGLVAPKLTVGISCAPDGVDVTAAVSVTLPVNPPAPEIVIVSVALLPCVTGTVDAVGASTMLGATLTVSAIVVEAVKLPETPVIVIVAAPVVAVPPAVNVTTLVPVVGLVANAAVTPLGKPEADRVTLPVNPGAPVTVTVSVAVLP
jgi:hypothetical protein